jgi:hypothetical protein
MTQGGLLRQADAWADGALLVTTTTTTTTTASLLLLPRLLSAYKTPEPLIQVQLYSCRSNITVPFFRKFLNFSTFRKGIFWVKQRHSDTIRIVLYLAIVLVLVDLNFATATCSARVYCALHSCAYSSTHGISNTFVRILYSSVDRLLAH